MNTNTRLYNLLNGFNGAQATPLKSKIDNLIDHFEQFAQEMIYGGYIRVRNDGSKEESICRTENFWE